MSNDEAKRFIPFPKRLSGNYDITRIRAQYFAGEAVEWVTFCRQHGYDWQAGGGKLHKHFEDWKKEKKSLILQEHQQDLREKLEKRKGRWNNEVLAALQDAPELAAFAQNVIKGYFNEVAREMAIDMKRRQSGEIVPEAERFYKKFSPLQVAALTNAMKNVTETRYKSLLLDQWHVKTAEQLSEGDPEKITQSGTQSIEFVVTDPEGKALNEEQIARMVSGYYDRPYNPADIVTVDVAPTTEGNDEDGSEAAS